MTTIAIAESCPDEPAPRPAIGMRDILRAYLSRRAERRLHARLARMPAHLIRDMGFDPELVCGAAVGTWDQGIPGLSPYRRAR
jgi:uncharacterized protein YjiS (DUF1127 family)